MFTGLVEGVGEIVALTPMAEGLQAGGQDLVSRRGAGPGGVGGGGRGLPDGGGAGPAGGQLRGVARRPWPARLSP